MSTTAAGNLSIVGTDPNEIGAAAAAAERDLRGLQINFDVAVAAARASLSTTVGTCNYATAEVVSKSGDMTTSLVAAGNVCVNGGVTSQMSEPWFYCFMYRPLTTDERESCFKDRCESDEGHVWISCGPNGRSFSEFR